MWVWDGPITRMFVPEVRQSWYTAHALKTSEHNPNYLFLTAFGEGLDRGKMRKILNFGWNQPATKQAMHWAALAFWLGKMLLRQQLHSLITGPALRVQPQHVTLTDRWRALPQHWGYKHSTRAQTGSGAGKKRRLKSCLGRSNRGFASLLFPSWGFVDISRCLLSSGYLQTSIM